MLGLRFTFNQPHQQSWWTDGTVDWLWPAAERAGVLHMGRSGSATDDAAFANLGELLALARWPNVAVKLSGAPSYSSAAYPWRNIHGYIQQIFDAFGPHRSFWGTDITRMPCSYRQCVTMFTEEQPFRSGADKDLVMGRALCHWIGWKLPG